MRPTSHKSSAVSRTITFVLAFLVGSVHSGQAQNTTNPSQPYDPDTATVALYHFDDGSGTTALDASPNALHGTLVGAAWTQSGRFEKALQFDGNDYLVLPGSSQFGTDDATYEAWVFITEGQTNALAIVDGYDECCNGGGRRLGTDSNRRAYALQRLSLGPFSGAIGTTVLPVGEWVHLAAVFDAPPEGRVRIVVNGTVEDDQPLGWLDAQPHFEIGRAWAFDYMYFHGVIDEVRISNVPRQSGTVVGVGVPAQQTTWGQLKAYWR